MSGTKYQFYHVSKSTLGRHQNLCVSVQPCAALLDALCLCRLGKKFWCGDVRTVLRSIRMVLITCSVTGQNQSGVGNAMLGTAKEK